MFSNLISSAPSRSRSRRRSLELGSSAAFHAFAFALLAWVGGEVQGELTDSSRTEDVTYVNIAEMEERLPLEDPEEASPSAEDIPDPEPATEDSDFTPGPPEDVELDPDLLAGFQELLVPDLLDEIPDPAPNQSAVDAADFRGRGTVGGFARGLRAPSDSVSTEKKKTERATQPAPLLPVVVDRLPVIKNLDRLSDVMSQAYPGFMRQSGIEGVVRARFVVDTEGRVEPESIEILEASNDAFREPTRTVLLALEWEPAQRNGYPVRILLDMPVNWALH